MEWHGQEDVEPLQDAKDKGLAQASRSRLYIFYFSDPRSHWVYRKSQYYQGGMRCCLMDCLLKVLSDMLQNPQLPSHILIWPKPKVKLGPTDSFYPAPRSSDVIATATNPRQIVSPIGISVSPRWDCNLSVSLRKFRSNRDERSVPPRLQCKLSVTCCNIFSPTEIWNRPHRVCLANSLFRLLPKSVPPSLSNRSNRVLVLP